MDTAPVNPYFKEMLQDYLESHRDTLLEVEHLVPLLVKKPQETEHIHALFRALHNLKSNAAMCQLDSIVDVAHPLESLMSKIRDKTVNFTQRIGELFLLVLDRIRLMAESMLNGKSLIPLKVIEIVTGLREMSLVPENQLDKRIDRLFYLISGETPSPQTNSAANLPQHREAVRNHQSVKRSEKQQADLDFLRVLSESVERRSSHWQGRTKRILDLAMQTNALSNTPINTIQLEAAVYAHDLGMAFMSEPIWHKQGKFDAKELAELHSHPKFSAGLINRMSGWEEAADMVLQHHERPDGLGYPNGLKANQIHPGASLLAIIDAFEAMTHERVDRPHKKSLLRAITELNACDNQFAQDWVKLFNVVVRKLLENFNAEADTIHS